jgi:hypothetical protein
MQDTKSTGTKQIREEPSQIKQSRLAYNRRGLEMCMDKIHLATLKRHVAFLSHSVSEPLK